MSIKIIGLNKTKVFLKNLPKKMQTEINKESGNFMGSIQKSAKLRAPRHSGDLSRSIFVRNKGKGNYVLEVMSPYGVYQEEGFAPHWIHAWMPTKNSLGTVGDALNIAGFIKVSKNKPFVTPAFEHNRSKLAQRMFNASSRAIKTS